jgi:glycosyltransferase involved in cell wall biosynthesis
MKKTIVHFINDLNRGGAEKMLVTVTRELSEYNNIIVTLDKANSFKEELVCDQYICLNAPSPFAFPLAALKLRRLINKHKPDIVHTHLFWPTFIARIATPKKIPLITTIHLFVASSMEYKIRHVRWLDRISYRLRKSSIIAVAKGALNEYFSFLKLKPYKAYPLYTFVDTTVFNNANILPLQSNDTFKLIAVGTLKEQKNFQYYINAFKQLRNEKIELHVYGSGHLEADLKKSLQENNITNIVLKGMVENINEIIPQYDLFTMASHYEGFSLAVLEAMALGMPMLLSDIDSFKEQCADTAIYFDLNNINDFVAKLKSLCTNKLKLQQMGKNAKERVLANFTLEHHLKGLRSIYIETLKQPD